MRLNTLACLLLTCALIGSVDELCGQDDPWRVLPYGEQPDDRRLGELKDLNGHFPFQVPSTPDAWHARAEELRRRVLVATGLWPMPEKTPLKAVIHGQIQRDGFTVERVYFESVPDHFVTGLLFRPTGYDGKRPAVLCPHGHGGRLQDYGEEQIKWLITRGAERFEDCGRYPKLSRCAQLARMGCVTFIFDMIGYADSVQLSQKLAHRFATQDDTPDGLDRWGFFSPQSELRLQSIMGLQTWNSIRALDFLGGLPDVDATRVGVTGGSGGGTQTILLCGIDSRPAVAFPQGMVSTSMQGGCTCENCSLLRVGTGNVELTALFAPRPQAMTAADDWTRQMMTDGFPQLKQLYAMLGDQNSVECTSLTHFPHNYNYVTRALMYRWFNRHLQLGFEEPIVEEHWEPLTAKQWTVWNAEHPIPKPDAQYETRLTRWMADRSDQQMAELVPKDGKSLQRYRTVIGRAIATMVGRDLPIPGSIQREKVAKENRENFLYFRDLIRLPNAGEELPVISFYPTAAPWNNQVVIWIDGRGKAGAFDADGTPNPAVRRLLDAGCSIVAADLLSQGEFLKDDPLTQTRVVNNPREFAGYTFGYNHTLFAQRVHDILSLVSFVRHDEHGPQQVHLVGVNGGGPLVAAARAIAGSAVDRAAIDTEGFRFRQLSSYRDPNFWPGIVKYGDLPAILALNAPYPLWIGGEEGETPAVARATYQAAGNRAAVVSFKGTGAAAAQAAAEWLLD
jgi:hypothetical protein